jgi:hypothetical protein
MHRVVGAWNSLIEIFPLLAETALILSDLVLRRFIFPLILRFIFIVVVLAADSKGPRVVRRGGRKV